MEVALLPQPPPSMRLRTNWLFRNAERKGKAGQIFQAEVVPIRGLEPVNEGCPTWRKERRKEIWLKLQGRLICFSREGQAPGTRVHRKGFAGGDEARRLGSPALAALLGPWAPGARAWLGPPSAPQPAARAGGPEPARRPRLLLCVAAERGVRRTSSRQAAFEVWAGRPGGRWMTVGDRDRGAPPGSHDRRREGPVQGAGWCLVQNAE